MVDCLSVVLKGISLQKLKIRKLKKINYMKSKNKNSVNYVWSLFNGYLTT